MHLYLRNLCSELSQQKSVVMNIVPASPCLPLLLFFQVFRGSPKEELKKKCSWCLLTQFTLLYIFVRASSPFFYTRIVYLEKRLRRKDRNVYRSGNKLSTPVVLIAKHL